MRHHPVNDQHRVGECVQRYTVAAKRGADGHILHLPLVRVLSAMDRTPSPSRGALESRSVGNMDQWHWYSVFRADFLLVLLAKRHTCFGQDVQLGASRLSGDTCDVTYHILFQGPQDVCRTSYLRRGPQGESYVSIDAVRNGEIADQ